MKTFYLLPAICLLLLFGCKKDNASSQNGTGGTGPSTTVDAVVSGIFQRSIFNSLGKPSYTLTISGKNFNKDFKNQKVLFNDMAVNAIAGDSLHFDVLVPDAAVATATILTIVANGKSKAYALPFKIEELQPTISGVSTEQRMPGSRLVISGTNLSPILSENAATLNGFKVNIEAVTSRDQTGNTGSATAFGDIYTTVLRDIHAGATLSFIIPPNAGTGKLVVTSYNKTVTYPYDIQILPSTFTSINSTLLRSISLDAAGNTYGIAATNTVVKITPAGTVSTLATIGASDFRLGDCVADAAGNVYVASGDDYSTSPGPTGLLYKYTANSSKIFKITPAGTVSVFAGSDWGLVDGQGTAAKFRSPTHIIRNAKTGDLYVTDALVIRKITAAGLVSTLAGSNSPAGTGYSAGLKDGQGTQASFLDIYAITVDANTGDLYLIDGGGVNTLRKVTAAGYVSSVSTTLANPPGSRFAAILPASGTIAMAVDVNSNILVASSYDVIIVKNGVVSNTNLNPFGEYINGITVNSANQLYISAEKMIYVVTP